MERNNCASQNSQRVVELKEEEDVAVYPDKRTKPIPITYGQKSECQKVKEIGRPT
jgi:hypothetical protein